MTVTYFYLVSGTKYCEGTTLATLAAENKNLVLKKLIACDDKEVLFAQFAFRPANDPASSPHCLIVAML